MQITSPLRTGGFLTLALALGASPALAMTGADGLTGTLVSQTTNAGPNGIGYLHTGESVYVADLDGDGDNDTVTGAKPWYEGVHVGLNDGTGLAFGVTNYGNGADDNDAVWGIDIGDLDGDGDIDVVALEKSAAGAWSIELYANNGSGDFSNRSTLVSNPPINFGDEPSDTVVLSDFDGDGDPDVAVAAGASLLVYTNAGGSLTLHQSIDSYQYADWVRDLQLGDVTGDGIQDIVAAAWTSGAYVFVGDGVGGFATGVRFATAGAIWSNGDLGDVDGDGDLDYVLKGRRAGKLELFLNDGTGTFGNNSTVTTGSHEYGMFLDIDGDGDDDYYYGGNLYEADGGSLTFVGTVTRDGTPIASLKPDGYGDLDGDGNLEAIFNGNVVVGTNALFPPGGGSCSDSDGDGVCDGDDVCLGDDLTLDQDADGICGDLDACDLDFDKIEPGVCGCGTSDDDADTDGITDCLEEEVTLTARRSHVRWLNSEGKWGTFTGSMELGGGLLAPDFRDGSIGTGDLWVTIDGTEVYSQDDIAYAVTDFANSTTVDNREKWSWKESNRERATFRWRNSRRYDSRRDATAPGFRDTDSIGFVKSRFIHADETRLRIRWNRFTSMPLTFVVDGVAIATIVEDLTMSCVEGTDAATGVTTTCLEEANRDYIVTSTYEVFEAYRGNGTERNHVIDVAYTGDRLGDGNDMAWYADADPSDGFDNLLHTHEAIDNGTETSVWFNAGGRFHVKVPLTGVAMPATATPEATLSVQFGDANTTAVVEGCAEYTGYQVTERTNRNGSKTWTNWRLSEIEEVDPGAETDGGSSATPGPGSNGCSGS